MGKYSMNKIKALGLLVVLQVVVSCSSAKFVATGPYYEARPDSCPIKIFITERSFFASKHPQQAYEELGIVEGEGSFGHDTLEKILPKMQRAACRAGGDALILLNNQKAVMVRADNSDEKLLVTATVIRWIE